MQKFQLSHQRETAKEKNREKEKAVELSGTAIRRWNSIEIKFSQQRPTDEQTVRQ